MEQSTAGVGSRVQHTRHGPGVIVQVHYAAYLVSFMEAGLLEVEVSDPGFEVLAAETLPADFETASAVEQALLRILRTWSEPQQTVLLGERWTGGTLVLQPRDPALKAKEIPLEQFFHKIVLLRDRLRVLEQQLNAHAGLSDEDKVNLQQYITRIYGSLTSFNVLFQDRADWFVGQSSREAS